MPIDDDQDASRDRKRGVLADLTTWKDKATLALLLAAVSWASPRFLDMWRTQGEQANESKAVVDLRNQLIACRNRELDDVKARILRMEHPGQ